MNLPDNLTFLIVEDLVSDSFLIQRQLKKICLHPEIRFVDSEISLINAIKTYIPDIVITDFNLIGMNAFDVIRVTKDYNNKIPVVVITAHLKNEDDKERLLEAGASGFFLKEPVNELNERLLPLFTQILEEKGKQLDKIGKERKKYDSSKSHSDFLRAFAFKEEEEDEEEQFVVQNNGFMYKLRNLFSDKK
ncbi:two-component system response regulator [Aequorivita sp. CIP111184]|uniref:response regulator n=1 Tax=Aequorivita sp. CIP111184 TaxID=2211356 RepID=UPI000DBC1C4D|nr:response regulator [Aequorivita sp. CIP111184]SRX54302.1 Sensor histidine kinase RcsC [Aequorivita sp. CIP111184]